MSHPGFLTVPCSLLRRSRSSSGDEVDTLRNRVRIGEPAGRQYGGPRSSRRSQGKPRKRWIGDTTAVVGKNWVSSARNREAWKIRGERPTSSSKRIKAEEEKRRIPILFLYSKKVGYAGKKNWYDHFIRLNELVFRHGSLLLKLVCWPCLFLLFLF